VVSPREMAESRVGAPPYDAGFAEGSPQRASVGYALRTFRLFADRFTQIGEIQVLWSNATPFAIIDALLDPAMKG
jgi:hypothetical protein